MRFKPVQPSKLLVLNYPIAFRLTYNHWGIPKPPRRLRSRSKYNPHQNLREMMRRVGQQLKRDGDSPRKAEYVSYMAAKVAGQTQPGLSPYFYQCNGPQEEIQQGIPVPGDDYDGLTVYEIPQDKEI